MYNQACVQLNTKNGMFELSAFSKDKDDMMPSLVLHNFSQSQDDTTVNVRVHSECITGDLFGSNRCDCGEQLQSAISYINRHGGILIYLRQEGRGIGIINKIKAYNQQDLGFDTAKANQNLGFDLDSRKYSDAISILKHFNVTKVNLLTNNPDKIEAFKDSGIEVLKRTSLEMSPSTENRAYLKCKKDIFGHILDLV